MIQGCNVSVQCEATIYLGSIFAIQVLFAHFKMHFCIQHDLPLLCIGHTVMFWSLLFFMENKNRFSQIWDIFHHINWQQCLI